MVDFLLDLFIVYIVARGYENNIEFVCKQIDRGGSLAVIFISN